jgi:hypothetical protein
MTSEQNKLECSSMPNFVALLLQNIRLDLKDLKDNHSSLFSLVVSEEGENVL